MGAGQRGKTSSRLRVELGTFMGDDGGSSLSEKVDANKDDRGPLWSKMGYTNKDLGPSWGKRVDGNKDHLGGPKGTRAYARKPYCDAWGNMVPALFPDEEEMGFVEQLNAHMRETTVRRRVLMPHFQRAAEYGRLYQGHGTFQFAPEVEMTPPTRGRGRQGSQG
ncbi:hypothetical protein F2Q69_00004691 [Brassica cretica]|uniref:Uncharacterized protein n=1 Tax=Brassica cretica TaxID=69181 RepID=A0A8S9P3G2_BRACR|nr:hypothetical protein F2Q69_00004691 [Brassica cretica]